MASKRYQTIVEYMNSRCNNRTFTSLEVQQIDSQRHSEKKLRDRQGLIINGKTVAGKLQINQRIAGLVNEAMGLKNNPLKPEHIRLYKRCWADEYTDRTGKCAWGFKEVRARMGYNPNTGMEE